MRSVIVGAGIAGLALAVELRRHGVEATVVEARYPGAGNSSRNVGRVRRMQLTPDLTEFSCRASDKWTRVDEITGGRNPLLYPTRYVWVLYGEDEREVVEPMQPMWDEHDARARVVEPSEVLSAVPVLQGGQRPVGGVIGDAAIVHHDAAVYAYYLFAREAGVRFEIGVRATGVEVTGGHVSGVVLADGRTLPADAVVNAAGGRSGEFARACGVEIPNSPIRREVLVTEPSKPFMTPAVTFYRPQEGWFNQTLRGELVAGVVDVDEPFGMNEESSVKFLGRTARVVLEKAPRLAELRVIRQWAGVYDTTPDKRPLVGEHSELPGLFALNGWSGRGILLAPLSAELLAREIAGLGRDPLLRSFDPNRFAGRDSTVTAHSDYYSGYAH
ncbi:MAG: FAD-binding oxidoreductase [Thermoleophilaceae bacterium]|nr:FAD-binding oxidoreductase [Thermoleophilaceae bacterium]